jgi:hypothetical protein
VRDLHTEWRADDPVICGDISKLHLLNHSVM